MSDVLATIAAERGALASDLADLTQAPPTTPGNTDKAWRSKPMHPDASES